MAEKIRILSIDGGGIRGIIPAEILIKLEEKLAEKTGKQGARIADYFDLIAGTSTGGILTCAYLCPKPGSKPAKPKFSAKRAQGLYLKRGGKIFHISFLQEIRSGKGTWDERYSAKELEKVLDDYFGKVKLSQLLKSCLITAYDIRKRKTEFFNRDDAKKSNTRDYFLRDIARATSAAPTFFEVSRIRSMAGNLSPLIDGGVFANNPALCAYAEVRSTFKGRPKAKDMVILSLGTGYKKRPYFYRRAKDWGKVGWARPVIDIMMSGVSETVDYQLKQIFDAVGAPNQYLRINGKLDRSSLEMDDASKKNLADLKKDAEGLARKFDKKLGKFADLLIR